MSIQKPSHPSDQEEAQIKVFVRVRPPKSDLSKRSLKVIERGVALNLKDKIHQLYFDGVLDEGTTQQQVFQTSCRPMLDDVLSGSNGCLFVYGQTGTGKTYTMGTLQAIKREDQGLIPLSLNYIINHLTETLKESDWTVSLSFMQIYMEDIYDLLNPTSGKLHIREDLEYGQTYVEDLVIVPISNYKQSIELINAGLKHRKTGNQRMNQVSSRSHTIFTVYVCQKISANEYMTSTLSLIDLAGSERVKKSNSTDLRLDEAKFINTSLSALGNVISGLAENNPQRFIPYRSSKLTRILKNSLTGRSKVTMICTCDISEENIYETYSTLLFADRSKEIRFPNNPAISIETFEMLDQEKELKVALEKSSQKEKEYLELIRSLQESSVHRPKDNKREEQLSLIIEGVYKLFGEINDHLRRKVEPDFKPDKSKEPERVTSKTTAAGIKAHISSLAQVTIDKVNAISLLAAEQKASATRAETDVLTSLLLDAMRKNFKLYETLLSKDSRDPLERELALDEYERDRRQEVLTKLKTKNLHSLSNNFEEIWANNYNSTNPIQNMFAAMRQSEAISPTDKSKPVVVAKETNNPKDLLKMLTKRQSERRQQQILVEDDENQQGVFDAQNRTPQGSRISYFQNKSSPTKESPIKEQNGMASLVNTSGQSGANEIKRLLDNLIASKAQFEERKKAQTPV